MSQNEQGVLYPFRLSGSRMRQSAVQLRRQGQALDALALVRRAAQQEDTASAWQALAVELRQLCNWEAAARVLSRVLAREPDHPAAWMDMARCMQALGQSPAALDCVYRQLQEAPWSPEGDAAREMLSELEAMADEKEPRRVQKMIHRGVTAWQSGNRPLGERRIRRALRIVADRERLLVTTAMMCMLEMDLDGALRYLTRALRLAPEDPRTLTALSTLYQQLGKRRLARGFLARAGKYADDAMAEDGFLTAAWAQDAWPELSDYLQRRMKRQPHRIPLLMAKATMLGETGDGEGAMDCWREILAIDPDDRFAAGMMTWRQAQYEALLMAPGLLPRSVRQQQMTELTMAGESLLLPELLQLDGRPRQLLDWFLASGDAGERQKAMEILSAGDDAALIPYLKELICRPFLRMDVRQWALVRLTGLGCREQMLMMTGAGFSMIACQPVQERKHQPWRIFLPLLLEETRRYHQSNEMAEFALAIWRCLSPEERMAAAGGERFAWCKAMEILYLRMAGEEQRAARVAADTPLSPRRISRVLRKIYRCCMAENGTE